MKNVAKTKSTVGEKHKAFFPSTYIFPKLNVNAPGDKYEQEAQRKPNMRQAAGGGFATPAGLSAQLQSRRGSGNALPEATQSKMSSAFGTDFSGVRVHTGSLAKNMSQSIQAKAFTHGSDIHFNQGAYQPGSHGGDKLLAHVVQQGGIQPKRIQKKDSEKEKIKPGEVIPSVYYGGVVPLPIALPDGQWYSIDREYNSTDPSRSFWKAAVFNTKNQNFNAYKSIAQRHAFYKFADAYLNSVKGTIRSKWFDAAAIVTGKYAVGAAEGINLWVLSDETDTFLKAGNKFLFKYNMKNFKYLMEGKEIPGTEGLRQQELDNRLVEFEQKKVGEFTEHYTGEGNLEDIISQINSSFGLPLAPSVIKQVIKENFTDKNIDFNFSKYEHRVVLGKKIVEILYN